MKKRGDDSGQKKSKKGNEGDRMAIEEDQNGVFWS
jgi:hypothetical protein